MTRPALVVLGSERLALPGRVYEAEPVAPGSHIFGSPGHVLSSRFRHGSARFFLDATEARRTEAGVFNHRPPSSLGRLAHRP
jgi:hypothetical protein